MKKGLYVLLLLTFPFIGNLSGQNAPPLPQRTLSVNVDGMFDFGTCIFTGGGDGFISVDLNGTPTYSTNVYSLGVGVERPSIYFKLCPGRMVNITYPTNPILLNCTETGLNISMVINQVRIGSTIITNGANFTSNKGCQDNHILDIAATLTIPSNVSTTSSSSYVYQNNTDLTITFIQQ